MENNVLGGILPDLGSISGICVAQKWVGVQSGNLLPLQEH
jgi:hypothetical protein